MNKKVAEVNNTFKDMNYKVNEKYKVSDDMGLVEYVPKPELSYF